MVRGVGWSEADVAANGRLWMMLPRGIRRSGKDRDV